MAPSNDVNAFKAVLRESRNIIAIAGAGLSAASGIPTFRGTGGMWRKYNATSLATPEGFDESPSLVWQFYHYRRESALKVKPNNAHRVLAALSFSTTRRRLGIAPDSQFHLITQNVDGLSPTANREEAATFKKQLIDEGSLIEMHGRLFDVICSDEDCDYREFNPESPIHPGLAGTEAMVEKGTIDPVIDESNLPHCPKCGKLSRPGVVWFGEMPYHLDEIDALVKKADLCLVIGTSSTVNPAASYAAKVKKQGGKVAVFNIEKTTGDRAADFLFYGPCEETLPRALGLNVTEIDGKVSVALDD